MWNYINEHADYMKRKLRVLVVSYLPWRNDISVGNTLSNIFQGMEDRLEIASIYFRDDVPNNHIVSRYFHISEKLLVKHIINRKNTGEEVAVANNGKMHKFSNKYNQARRMRWEIMLLAQDMIGVLGKWKSEALEYFIKDFNPDIVFGPLGRVPVTNSLMSYVSKKFSIPLVTYPWDDHYSLKKVSYSPFFWVKTFVERHFIKKCAKQSTYMYAITKSMQKEYEGYFNKKIKLLYKGYNFNDPPVKRTLNSPIKIVYMGNIGSGRWKIIANISTLINKINKSTGRIFELYIYTLSPISTKIRKCLDNGDSHLMKPVPSSEILNTMNASDILLHVEPTQRTERSFFRLSFSTKLVDYFYNGRCILAVGGETASMDYLRENDAAIVETDSTNLLRKLTEIANNPNVILEYSKKSWDCGCRNHQIGEIQKRVYDDFCAIINKNRL